MFNQKVNRTNEETYQLVLPWTEENVDRLTSEVERLEEISRERSAEADRYPGQEQKTEKVLDCEGNYVPLQPKTYKT